jgi:hypothetical protein
LPTHLTCQPIDVRAQVNRFELLLVGPDESQILRTVIGKGIVESTRADHVELSLSSLSLSVGAIAAPAPLLDASALSIHFRQKAQRFQVALVCSPISTHITQECVVFVHSAALLALGQVSRREEDHERKQQQEQDPTAPLLPQAVPRACIELTAGFGEISCFLHSRSQAPAYASLLTGPLSFRFSQESLQSTTELTLTHATANALSSDGSNKHTIADLARRDAAQSLSLASHHTVARPDQPAKSTTRAVLAQISLDFPDDTVSTLTGHTLDLLSCLPTPAQPSKTDDLSAPTTELPSAPPPPPPPPLAHSTGPQGMQDTEIMVGRVSLTVRSGEQRLQLLFDRIGLETHFLGLVPRAGRMWVSDLRICANGEEVVCTQRSARLAAEGVLSPPTSERHAQWAIDLGGL